MNAEWLDKWVDGWMDGWMDDKVGGAMTHPIQLDSGLCYPPSTLGNAVEQ